MCHCSAWAVIACEAVTPVGDVSFKQLPFVTSVDTFVAVNAPQHANTSSGILLVFRYRDQRDRPDLSNPESMQLYLETRFEQLKVHHLFRMLLEVVAFS